jgi:hypothetical protein
MAADPLAQFRKKPLAATEASPVAVTEPEGYVAFEAKDMVSRLRIRRANDPTRAPGYAYLLDVMYDERFGLNFVLIYTFMIVLVRGKNLQAVAAAIESGNAEFIQEFDAERWARPKDAKAPFIESIKVEIKEDGPDLDAAEKKGTE